MLFLFASNFDEFTESVLLFPLGLVLVFSLIIYGILLALLRNIHRSAVIASSIIIFSLSYKRISEPLKGLNLLGLKLDQENVVFILVLLLISFIILLTYKFKDRLHSINRSLTFFSVLLLTFTTVSILGSEIRTGRLFNPQVETKITSSKSATLVSTPDIYYFIFDRYGSSKSLNMNYKFDNSNFEDFLTQKGFYIAKDSTANYPKTFLSLASSLNMEYVNYLTEKTNGGKSTDQSIVTPLIQNNKVLKYLKNKGYTYIHMGSWWTPTAQNPNADKNYIMPNSLYFGADEFTSGLLNTTIAASVLKQLLKDPMDVSDSPRNNDHRKRIIYEFQSIKEISTIASPKFVFVHILIPHDPFVLDKNCTPISEEVVNKNSHQVNYINQIQCANKNIQIAVSDILKNSPKPPVIILQADEGPFPMNSSLSKDQAWKNVDDVGLNEKFPILNAYYFPDKKYDTLYSSITPVNSFRLILNKYFAENFTRLEDKNYIFEDEKNYYKFLDITSRIKKEALDY